MSTKNFFVPEAPAAADEMEVVHFIVVDAVSVST